MTLALWASALAQVVAFALVGWAAGDWLLDNRVIRRGDTLGGSDLEWPERMLLSVLGFVVFGIACMVANVVTGGVVFGVPGVVPVAAAALLFFRWRRGVLRVPVPWRSVVLIAVPLVLVWMLPVFASETAARSGDTPWHLGWTNQLLSGQPVPQGPAPEEAAANAYPWGFHAFLGALVRLAPGSDVMAGLVAGQLILLLSIPLAAACIARRISAAAGWAAAAVAGGMGGFGWVALQSPAFATSPRAARHGADLVIASPNSVYELFPPPLPRELGLVLLAAAGVVLALGLERRRRELLVVAGVSLGAAGLVSVPALVAGTVWALAAVALCGERSRIKQVASVFVPAVVVFLLWAGPVIRHLVLHGGFVNVSPSLGREWPLWTALAAWGLLGPLAALGAFVSPRSFGRRTAWAFGASTLGLLGLAIARGALDWELAGNATVLHQGRIWPVAHLLGAAFAGAALWWLWSRLERRRPIRAVVFAGLLVAGAASPVLAAVSLAESMREGRDGYPYVRPDLAEGGFVRQAAGLLGPGDTLRVDGPRRVRDRLGFHIFSFSGVRLARFDDPRLDANDLRIRYRDLAVRWDRSARAGGYDADYIAMPEQTNPDADPAASGTYGGMVWVLVEAEKPVGVFDD